MGGNRSTARHIRGDVNMFTKQILMTVAIVTAMSMAIVSQSSFAQTATTASVGNKAANSTGRPASQSKGQSAGKAYEAKERRNPACERILSECKKVGFIEGQWKKDNGLWKDCFDPIVKGKGSTTRNGKPISVPINPSDVSACRGAEGHHEHGNKSTATGAASVVEPPVKK